ncbi:MAG: N-ethylammeline chlorohydrolase [Candidatus Poseidoniales archaeon]|nr:MAG: N-ethylammeline chlorohydrolase [Candidatus Poseidoniales archaeon]
MTGDVLLHADGSWSASNGDEDVVEDLDGSKRLITRSFQNWHTHLAMQLNARISATGFPFTAGSTKPSSHRSPHHPRIRTNGKPCAAAEMIRTGSSFAADMYFFQASGRGAHGRRLTGLIGGPVSDAALPSHPDAASALEELDGLLATNSEEDLVQYAIATHSVYLCSEDTLLRAADLAQRRQGRLHIHVSETRKEIADCHAKTGLYPVEYLDSIGFFQPGTVCAHASWVKKNEIRMLKKHEATAVHCPSSNMKLACGGTLSLPAYREAGVDVRLGTDGAASSGNGLNMQAEARLASLVQRHDHWDSTLLPAVEAMDMATKGSKDWAVWNLDDVRMRPRGRSDNRHLANLLFNGADCMDLWVGGRALRRDGITLTVDENAVLDEIDQAVATYYEGVE